MNHLPSPSRSIFGETRTRILAWYVILMTALVGLSIPIFTKLVIAQVNHRVREDLKEELDSFTEFVASQATTATNTDAATIFDGFLRSHIPADKTFLIATIQGEFYRSSPISLPTVINRDSQRLQTLAQTKEPIRGFNVINDPRWGDIVYKAEPLTINNQVSGVLIAAHIPEGERQEVMTAVIIVIEVLMGALLIAVILAWLMAGKVLKPIRTLMQAARSISETDMSQRIPVRGQGEMGELAKTFNAMMDRLEAAFQTQREFVNDASHELRTPLTIIRGHLELIDMDDDPTEREATIALVLDEIDRMNRFVQDLALLAKAERTDFLQLETVDVATLTEQMYTKAQGLGMRHWKLAAIAQGKIIIDPQRITQAIMNLAANAIQHTTEADTITIGSAIKEQNAYFWVKDTGVGISREDQQRIFQRFARASHSRRRSQGAGLGLAIVQAIAQSHRGCVELSSQTGVGSTFTLIIPIGG